MVTCMDKLIKIKKKPYICRIKTKSCVLYREMGRENNYILYKPKFKGSACVRVEYVKKHMAVQAFNQKIYLFKHEANVDVRNN